jgi:hypothetical protein
MVQRWLHVVPTALLLMMVVAMCPVTTHGQQTWKDVKTDISQFNDMTTFALYNFFLSGAEMLDRSVDVLNATLARVEATLKMVPAGGSSSGDSKKVLRRNATVVQVMSVLTRERLARAVTAHDQLVAAGYQYLLVYWAETSTGTQKAEDTAMLRDLLPGTAFAVRDIDSFTNVSAAQREAAAHYCAAPPSPSPSPSLPARCAEFLVPTVRRRLPDGTTDPHHVHWVMDPDVRWVGNLAAVLHKLTPPSEVHNFFSSFFGDCLNNINLGPSSNSSSSIRGRESALKCLAERLNRDASSLAAAAAAAPVIDLVTACGSSRAALPRSRNPLKNLANAVRAAAAALNQVRRRVQRRLCGKGRADEARPTCPPACRSELARYSGAFLNHAEDCLAARARAHVSEEAECTAEVNATCGTYVESGGGPQTCPHLLAHARRLTLFDALDVGLREGVLSKDWRNNHPSGTAPPTSAAEYELARAKAAAEMSESLIFNKRSTLYRAVA